jgi:hypothetical protein
MSEERYKDALKQIDAMDLGPRVKEIIRRAFHPDEPCPQCEGVGEVPNTSKWCIFEEEGPMTLKCLKFNKYVQNSNICRDCPDYAAKYPKMTCPSCSGKKFTKVELQEVDDRFEILDL